MERSPASRGGKAEVYGIAGVSSYLSFETIDPCMGGGFGYTLDVYATPEDRPASMKDRLATASEVGLLASGPRQRCGISCGPDTAHCGSANKKMALRRNL